jgi:uncharacterized protein (TIGR00730 family)
MQKDITRNEAEKGEKFIKRDIHRGEIDAHLEHICTEFREGFQMIAKYPKTVTMFGSSMISPESDVYKSAEELAALISRETGYTILSGGGPGTMEAFNKGAFDAGGKSVGFNISLPHNRETNRFMTDSMKFSYFFARKTMMVFTAEAYIFLPGGFGTLDELFSVLVLIQTDKIPRVPIILFNSSYWNEVLALFKNTLLQKFGTIRKEDLEIFTITDSPEEVVDIIKKAPVSEWWRNLN